jgi:hypothetical protein
MEGCFGRYAYVIRITTAITKHGTSDMGAMTTIGIGTGTVGSEVTVDCQQTPSEVTMVPI